MANKRQDIVDAFKTLLQTISVANGYETELGSNILEWEDNLPDENLPAASIADTDDDISTGEPSVTQEGHNLTMEVTGKALEVGRPPLVARQAQGDVIKALGTDVSLGGLVTYMFLTSQAIEKDHKENVISSFSVVVNIFYESNQLDPF